MPDTILQTMQQYLSGTSLSLPASAFGSGGIETVLNQYFTGGTLTAENVVLQQDGEAVTFANASGTSAPLNGAVLSATFRNGGSGVQMQVTATPPAGWSFGTSWPLLAGSWTDHLSVSNASLVLTSVATGPVAAGLLFSGDVGLGGWWSAVQWLLGGRTAFPCSGLIQQKGTAPQFAFTMPIGTVDVPLLGNVAFELDFTCNAVSGAVVPPGGGAPVRLLTDGRGPVVSPWVPQPSLVLEADLPFAGTTIPITVDLTNPTGAVPITATLTSLATVSLTDFASVLPGGTNLAASLPPPGEFDPGQYLTPKSLTFTLLPAARRVSTVGIVVGTPKAWTVTNGISVGPIDLSFTVPVANPSGIVATVSGLVNFNGGSFRLGASYPGFTFSGGLTYGSKVDLISLLDRILPAPVNATLYLDELDFVVQPSVGAFSLTTGLSGHWSIPVGIATIALTGAWLQVDRTVAGNGTSTTGAIGVTGNLALQSAGTIAFDGSWTLPGSFATKASLPNLNLSALAQTLSGTSIPSSMPDVALTNGQLAISLDVATSEYNFTLASGASVNGNALGTGVFVVRKAQSTGYGFLIGLVTASGWSPADIFPDLGPIFRELTFNGAGLLVSTLPAGSSINLPTLSGLQSLPPVVDPGFTFFASLALTGSVLGPVADLFGGALTFDLLAVVNTASPAKSEFKAIFLGSQGKNAIDFQKIVIDIQPLAMTFSIEVDAVLHVQSDAVTLSGKGSISGGTTPTMTFTILIANWIEPLGIEGLVVQEFGLQVGVEEAGLTVGALGAFVVGSGARQFTFVIGAELVDFEVPGAIIFQLHEKDPGNPLMLTDLVRQFTSVDLSSVPVLDAIGFKDLDFWVVDDPNGFTVGDYTFPPGIGIGADIFLYSWEAKFDLQVSFKKGIIASGSINKPIELGGVLTISDVSGLLGPSGSIDTTNFTADAGRVRRKMLTAPPAGAYMTLNGQVKFLGIEESLSASVSKSSFEFDASFKFLDTLAVTLNCSLVDDKNFSAAASFSFGLDATVGPLEIGGVTLIPQVHIQASSQLALGIAINPQVVAQLSLDLSFSWSSLPPFDVKFTLSVADIAGELTNLRRALITWLENHVAELFQNILSDVSKWIDAVKNVFTSIGASIDAVADALANYFRTGVEAAAAFLKDLDFAFNAIVDALVTYFKIAFDEAVKIVEGQWHDCAMSNGEDSAYGRGNDVTVRDLEFAFTCTANGRRLLYARYAHEDEIRALLAPHPHVSMRLGGLASSRSGASDPQALGHVVIRALMAVLPDASPPLRAAILDLLPLVVSYRSMTIRQLREVLANERIA